MKKLLHSLMIAALVVGLVTSAYAIPDLPLDPIAFGSLGTLPYTAANLGQGTILAVSGATVNSVPCASGSATVVAISDGTNINCGGTATPGGTITQYNVLIGAASSQVASIVPGTAANLLLSQGATSNPAFEAMTGDTTITSSGVTTTSTLNSDLVAFTGPSSSLKTFTLPNSSQTIMTENLGIDSLAAAGGNYAMGSHKLTGLANGTASGDSLAFGLSGATSGLFGTAVSPGNGGVGAMTGAPMWARFFGNGADSAGPASGTINPAFGEKDYTSWTCTGAISVSANNTLIVRSQGTVALNTGCTITTAESGGLTGTLGGGGGSGGSEGATNSTVGLSAGYYNTTNQTPVANYALSVGGAASSSNVGNDAAAIGAAIANLSFSMGPPVPAFAGGASGSKGGGTGGGGAAGTGRSAVIIIAPTITVASGVIINTSGVEGADASALLQGAGGGGGGGAIWLISQSFTDSGGIYKYGGGPGGNCTTPSITASGGGCTASGGCGKDALFTLSGVTSGGLDATKIAITSAGTGYQISPDCTVNAGASGLTGSPACHFTLSGNTIASVVIDTAGSGATFASYAASCDTGGQGAPGFYMQQLIQ